jgi:hypothetical protein
MEFSPAIISVHGVAFRLSFARELRFVLASLEALDPAHTVLASCVTTAWKLKLLELLEGLTEHRNITLNESFTIIYHDDADDPDHKPGTVTLSDGFDDQDVPIDLFTSAALHLARRHVDLVGADYFSWLKQLSPAARDSIYP